MKKLIELLELLRALSCYLTTKCEIERLVAKDKVEKVEKMVKDIDDAIAELKSPRWYTPEQWEKRTGKAWSKDWAVYALYENKHGGHRWWYCGWGYEAIDYPGVKLLTIICATEAGPPPDDWEPEAAS
jgi:hypothetical protein